MSFDSVVAVAWDVLKHLGVPIKRQFDYVMRSKRYADDLRNKVEKLKYEADRVQDAKEVAENNLLSIHVWVPEFLASAEKAVTEAGDLLSNFEKASKTCCYGAFPDPNCRHTFSRTAKLQTDYIKNLVQDYSNREVSLRGSAPGNVPALTPAEREGKDVIPLTTAAAASSALMSMELQGGGIGKSREPIIRETMAALADNSNSVVGVHGMGGVGKSTLVEEVKRKLSEDTLFGWVTMANVSENPDINRIQGEIAHALNLDMKNEANVNVRAELLRTRLEKEGKAEKRVLIILDNLWERLDLKSVGIPCGLDNKVRGCKLLLTSRSQDVLRREMGCDRDFHLDGLQEVEAKELFQRMVGDKVHDSEFKPFADEALHKCAGLPFLIIAIAKIFKDANLSEWKDALHQIEMSANKGIGVVINSTLQLSYDRFKGEEGNELKLLLRLCAVYGVTEPSLENLMRYGMGLGLFGEGSSIEYGRNRLSSLIHTLQASSLLLDKGEDGFGIHDLVRGFVTSVASRDDPFLVLKDNDKPVAKLQRDKLKSCTAVCFPYVDMKELPKELDCPELQIFLLFTNNKSLEVPDSLFGFMKKLMVLNVTGIHLTCLPSSFQFLEKLHTLCLEGCLLEDVAILGELKRLQILSFVSSKIQRLPKEIGQLVELRLLDLNYCSKLHIIEPGVLESLIKLEELYMEYSFDQWNVVDQTPPTNASLIELNHMVNLCTLDVSIRDPSMLPGDLNIQKLTKYKIRICYFNAWHLRDWSSKHKASRTLILQLNPPSDIFKKGCIQTTFDTIDALLLDGLCGNEQSICALSREGFPKLKHLQVYNNPSIPHILQYYSHMAFKMLESLILENLINLEKICHSHISPESFSTLKVLRVKHCDNMKVLFPPSVVRGLPKLEEIVVVGCKLMRGIVEADDCGKVELHNLRVLILRYLPNISNFFNAGSAHSSSTLDDKVSTQIAFFNGQQISIPSLESLTMEGLLNMKEIWSDESPLELSNLRSLELVQCNSLLKVINSQSLVKLCKLHNLCIRYCNSMQEIFDLDVPSTGEDLQVLSKLTTLKLNELGSLRHIWNKNPYGIVSLHNLKKLEANHRDNLRFMFFPSTVKSLAQLRDLTVQHCKKMEAIVMEEEGLGLEALETPAFPMLADLTLIQLESFKCFYLGKSSPEARSQDSVKSHSTALFNREVTFPSLETLNIIGLDNIELIWNNQVAADSFLKLKSLFVEKCDRVMTIVPSFILGRLLCLESLMANTCGSLEIVFELQPLNSIDGHHVALLLKKLMVSRLPKLKCVWKKELHHHVKFQHLHSVSVFECKSLNSLFPASVVKDLIQLEELEINRCGIVELIEKEEGLVPRFDFPKLTSLKLKHLTELKCICSETLALHWPALKTLEVQGCNKLEIFASQPENEMLLHKHALFLMEKVAFQKLETLEINGLANLKFIFFPSVVKSLTQLKKLIVSDCKNTEAIIMEEEGLGLETSEILEFPMLTNLCLERLKSLTCFSHGKCARESRSRDCVRSHSTALFNQEVAFPSLETLNIIGLDNIELVWENQVAANSFLKLKSLFVDECNKVVTIVPSFILGRLLCLESLKANTCDSLEVVFELQLLNSIDGHHVALQLKELMVSRLPKLKCVWKKGLHHQVKFQRLHSISISECKSLNSLFPASVAKDLIQLEELEINRCGIVELIEKEEGLVPRSDFPKLTSLKLKHLTELKCICTETHALHWPALKTLEVHGCNKLEIFASQLENEMLLHKQALFLTEKVAFQKLETLDISGLANLKFIFFPSMVKSLTQLKKLTVSDCKNTEAIIIEEEGLEMETSEILAFPMLTILCLERLKSLTCFSHGKCARESRSQDRVRSHATALFNQEVAFQKLETLDISGLANLKFIFSPSMVKSLTQLKKLTVSDCKNTEAIIIEEEGLEMETSEILAFPMLTILCLERLKSLTCFSHGKCARESRSQDRVRSHATALFNQEVPFPNLENLYIKGVDNIEMIWHDQIPVNSFSKLKLLSVSECKKLVSVVPSFILGQLLSLETLQANACNSLEVVFKLQPLNPLDGISVACSPLKNLLLMDLSELNCVWDKELYCHIKFWCLRLVTLWRCFRLTSLFPASIARDLIQLEELEINQCNIVELIEKERPNELSINVEAVKGPCHELKVSSSIPSYFQHMKTLDVSHCHGLSNMFTPTMATNLVELRKLRISKCKLLTKVISDEGGKEGHVVTFNQLKYIELVGLTRLRCFSSGKYTLKFPLLEDIIVTRCPKMKFFHEGQIEAPKLERVQVHLNEGYGVVECQYFWKGNLNTTIQNMLEEMDALAWTKFMRLFEFPKLIGKWHSELNPITSSWQLESLVVDKCPFIYAIPSNLMLVLKRMTRLQVHNCKSLEEIFNLEGLEAVDCTQVLPRLQSLCLVNLPKLRQLWNRDLQGTKCFNSLQHLSLYKCNNLRHAFVSSMTWCLPNLWEIEIKECDQMKGVIADEEGQGSTMEEITFPKLEWITLECLPSLTSFLSWKNHSLECPILSKLSIAHCPEMRSLTWQSSMEIDNGNPSLFTPQVQFPRLESMVLSHMDNLSKIWTDNPLETLTFDYLEEMEVRNCKGLGNLFPYWVATSLTRLNKLQVEYCGIKEIVASGGDTPHCNTAQVFISKLTSLVLHDMPQLESFCHNLPTLDWPFLEELRVTHCGKVNMLSFAASMNEWTQRNDQQELSDQEAHSSLERDCSNLRSLLLVDKDIEMIQDGNLRDGIFGKSKALTLACFHDKKAVFPLKFLLERFHNLQSLEVFCSSFEDIFLDEGLVDEGKHLVLGNLRELKLNELHNLKRVWREDSSVSKILQSINTFEVWDCPCLTTIFPAATFFQNLTKLVVKNSSGMVHLITVSTVTNLVHLYWMTIIGCERMKEVVANDGDGEEQVISFKNLYKLTLQHLPNLECFSSISNCIFEFRRLSEIEVEECPKMKTFSKDYLSTPELEDVSLFRYKWGDYWWKGDDLNRTIQKFSA